MSKATKIMNQRNEYKCELVNELNTLGFQVSTLDELIPVTPVTKEETIAPIVINKGHIVEVQTVKEVYVTNEEELDRLYDENARHIRRINELAADNEKLLDETMTLENEIAFRDGQILGLNAQVKELEDKVAELQSALNAKKLEKKPRIKSMLEELKDYKEELEKGDDKPVSKLDMLKKIKKAPEFTLESALEQQEAKLAKEAEEKQVAIDNLPEHTFEYSVVTHKGLDTITHFAIQGQFNEYAFEATNNHHMPIVYGCFNMDTINFAKEVITNKVDKFSFMSNVENNAANYSHINDAEFPLVVWRLTDDKGNITYHAYTEKYVLIWDNKKFKVPARKMLQYALDKDPKHYRKLEQQKHTKKLSDKFMAVCADIWPEDFTNDDNDPEPTKAVVRITKEESSNKQPISYNGPIDDFTPITNDGNDDLDCDDLDI